MTDIIEIIITLTIIYLSLCLAYALDKGFIEIFIEKSWSKIKKVIKCMKIWNQKT